MARRILFVCTGNICRSPMAQAVAEHMAAELGKDRMSFDSAGTGDWHAGEAPDARAIKAAEARGYTLNGQQARAITDEDYSSFDHLIAMDKSHQRWLLSARGARHLPETPISLLMDWSVGQAKTDVPDPYYGQEADFEQALDLIEKGIDGLLKRI